MSVLTNDAVKALMMMEYSETSNPKLDTLKTKRFKYAIQMKELSVRLGDVETILQDHCKIMINPEVTKLELRTSISSITKSVIA